MRKLKIFISHNENSYDAAVKIKEESLHDCQIIYIEDFVKENDYSTIKNTDIIHFSCNSNLIYVVMNNINNVNCFIFNKTFLLKKYSKLNLQLKLKNAGINTPKIYNNLQDVEFPVFCKENKHTGIVFEAFTTTTLKKLFSKFNETDFYFEENLFKKNAYITENKYYYSNGIIHARDGKNVPKEIKEMCSKIKKCFEIDIYSVDVIRCLGKIFLIDFNPAVGFYLTKSGRRDFLKMVYDIVGDINEN